MAVRWNKILAANGKGGVGEVPKEYETFNKKVKELQELLDQYIKQLLKYKLSFEGYNKAGEEVAIHLRKTEDLGLGKLFVDALSKMADAQMAAESSHLELRSKVTETFVPQLKVYIQNSIIPSREAKKAWSRATKDLESSRAALDAILRQSKLTEPLKMLQAQRNYQQSRMKELCLIEESSNKLVDTMWERDVTFFIAQIDFMIEMHDKYLGAYDNFCELEKINKQTFSFIQERKQNFNGKLVKRKKDKTEEEDNKFGNRFQPLVELLSADDLGLLNALCVCAGQDQDSILASVIRILDAHKKTLPIIKLTITNEVESTNNATTLFRGNSTATKLMTAFTRMTGQKYLEEIKPLIHKVNADGGEGYEVDSNKLANKDENLDENMKKLMSICQEFTDIITSSLDRCPLPFREMAHHLQNEVVKRFPNSKFTSVGGFIFLRFFCPAIPAPDNEAYGLISPSALTKPARRALVLISKCIQNLANGLKFGSKESYMNPMNTFIENNLERVQKFLDSVAVLPENSDYDPLCSYKDAIDLELPKLTDFIVKNLEKIGRTLVTYHQEALVEPLAIILGDLGEIGVEPEKTKKKKGLF
eukprot:TRINITY_DN308_c1_g1_i1.p1 TRINITY_DN308_c1_g1~~TRINITY_DN308_c1_g1_i1.p1  ORF type:complete len:590 (+),score=125.67 TRINITY_DN308_c1_g1_i1:28-1797(+)